MVSINTGSAPDSDLAGKVGTGRFASLVADWYWELDSELRYVFHAGRAAPLLGDDHESLQGMSRLDMLDRLLLGSSDALREHHRALRAHEPLDLVLPIGSGDCRFVRVVARPEFDADGEFSGYVGCGVNVTDRVALRDELERAASHDELTGIFNRRVFEQQVGALHAAGPVAGCPRTLCLLDLDRFKLVNDTAGHAAGDELLRGLALLMREALTPDELLARLGGDEFGLLLDADAEQAKVRCDALIAGIADFQFWWEGRVYSVGACIGLTPLDAGCGTLDELMDRADTACYSAKNNGRNQSVTFSRDSEAWRRHRAELESIAATRQALQADRLRLYMQEIRPAPGTGHAVHHEILLRLEQEDGVLLQPADFIPVAERYGVMQELDRWVLEHCLDTLDAFHASGEPLSLSVNLSGNTLSDVGAMHTITRIVHASGDRAASLCFEITESAAIANLDCVVDFMHELKQAGVRFALDDFGAGLSSFAYLRFLPIDYLKIDGYFIRHLSDDATNKAITAAFIRLSQELGIATVAESVETKSMERQLIDMGIDFLQGFGISRPVDVDDALAAVLAGSVRRVVNA